jgi:hypothetical protein
VTDFTEQVKPFISHSSPRLDLYLNAILNSDPEEFEKDVMARSCLVVNHVAFDGARRHVSDTHPFDQPLPSVLPAEDLEKFGDARVLPALDRADFDGLPMGIPSFPSRVAGAIYEESMPGPQHHQAICGWNGRAVHH